MMQASEVKTGMRVQYCDGRREFEAVATSNAHLGFHPGRKRSNYHIDLAYLSDAGELVKVLAAPLLTGVASEEEQAKIGAMEFSAASRTARRSDLAGLGGKLTPSDLAKELQERPETIGWGPKQVVWQPTAELRRLATQVAQQDEEIAELKGKLAMTDGLPSAVDLDVVAELQKAADATAEPVGDSGETNTTAS